jgi:flagellar protein FliO/FliZ
LKALFLLTVLVLCVLGQPVYSQETTNPEELIIIGDEDSEESVPADGEEEPRLAVVSTWDFVRMILILAAVVGVIYLFFHILKRGAGGRRTERDLINIHDYRSLGGSRGLYLVEVGSSVYLVGASDSGVNLVSEVTEKESLDTIRLTLAQSGPPARARKNFAGVIGELFGAQPQRNIETEGTEFIQKQKERLRRLR